MRLCPAELQMPVVLRVLLWVPITLPSNHRICTQTPTPVRCRRTVQQLLHAFRRLGSVLRGVLAPGVLVEVAAQLVQRVCTRIVGESPAGCCVLSGWVCWLFCGACAPASLVSCVSFITVSVLPCGLHWHTGLAAVALWPAFLVLVELVIPKSRCLQATRLHLLQRTSWCSQTFLSMSRSRSPKSWSPSPRECTRPCCPQHPGLRRAQVRVWARTNLS